MQAVRRTVLGLEHLAKHCQRALRINSQPRHRHVACCSSSTVRSYSSEVLEPPQPDTEPKQYATHIQQIVDQISRLTLLEVSDLNDLLKKTLKIQDAPMMAAMPAAALKEDEEEAAPVQQEQTQFTVKLVKFDATKKVALIKEMKNVISGMNLVQAKKFVESLPQNVMEDISKEEAEKLKATLTAVGGEVEIE